MRQAATIAPGDELKKLAQEAKARVPLAGLIGARVALRRNGREHTGLCPFHAEKTPSFTVNEHKGFYHCFGCGAHGDAIGFLMAHDGLGFVDAVWVLATEAGLNLSLASACSASGARTGSTGGARCGSGANAVRRAPAKPLPRVPRETEAEAAAKRAGTIAWARGLFGRARAAAGTPVEGYLRARGIDVARLGGVPPTIRYMPDLRHRPTGLDFPAMLAAIQGEDGKVCGVHRTFLKADGSGKAAVSQSKMMAGIAWGGATRLAAAGPVLGISEGIETGLSFQLATGIPVWAALSLGNIAGSGVMTGGKDGARAEPHPERPGKTLPVAQPDMTRPGLTLPDFVEEVILIEDGDSGDRHAANALMTRAAVRFANTGKRVRRLWPGTGRDFNDLLRKESA